MHPTTIHQLAMDRQAEYRREADQHRLAMAARHGRTQDHGDALAAVRKTIDLLFHPLRTTGSSPA